MTMISIAMATYNGARFIQKQLDSFSHQTLSPSELIVCDDGSTDSTISIIQKFAHSTSIPVVLVTNPIRLGYTANFLKAAHLCTGDLIAFSDQDDEWLPEKLEFIREASEKSDALLLAHAAEWIDEDSNSRGVVYPTHRRFRKHLRKYDFPGHAIVIKRSFLEMIRRSISAENYKRVVGDLEFGHDALLMEVALATDRVLFIRQVLSRWRVYSETAHAWTNEFKVVPSASASLADRIYPHDLAQKYAAGEHAYRSHATLLGCVLQDLADSKEGPTATSRRLSVSMNLMARCADVMELRAKFYSAQTRRQRMRLMLQGFAMGQYRRADKGGVGMRNAVRDLLAAVLLLPRQV
jgi:glycosyltransferase involved in cell wall biosynthesis